MKVNLYNTKAEVVGQVDLPKSIFGQEPNDQLVSQAVRVYTSNQRKSTARAKTRSEVAGTTKKIWSQKGTGRARHGDSRAPIFVGGGSAHGPQGDQNYKLKLSKKMAKYANISVLSQFAQTKSILVVKSLEKIDPKTKIANILIENLRKKEINLSKAKRIGLVLTSKEKNIKQSFSNLADVSLIYTESINPYLLLKNNYLIFSQNSLVAFEDSKK